MNHPSVIEFSPAEDEEAAEILRGREAMLKKAVGYRKFWLWWKHQERKPKYWLVSDYSYYFKSRPEAWKSKQEILDEIFVEYIRRWQATGVPPDGESHPRFLEG